METDQKFKVVYACHPGITLREKLDEMQMSVKTFALLTAMPEKVINAVLSEKESVTQILAEAFEQVTQIPAHFWLNLQRNYDESLVYQWCEEKISAEEKFSGGLKPVLQ